MWSHLLFPILFLLAVSKVTRGSLLNDLLVDYDKRQRPVIGHNALEVTLNVTLHQLLKMDEKDQKITINAWTSEEWMDDYLTWDPEQYHGVTHIIIPYDNVWQPDTYLYSNLEMYRDSSERRMVVSLTTIPGKNATHVLLQYPAIYYSICLVDITNFPFDTQKCNFTFGSWSYSARDIHYKTAYIDDLTDYIQHQEWALLNFSSSMHELCYPEANECYSNVNYELVIQRRPLYYVVNLIIPTIIITELCSLGLFTRSSDSGERFEKITLGLTAILALSVFLLIVSDQMPRSSLVISLMGGFFLSLIILLAVQLVFAVLIIYLQRQGQRNITGIWSSWNRKPSFIEANKQSAMLIEFESEETSKMINDERGHQIKQTNLLQKISNDLETLNEHLQKITEGCSNETRSSSEWKKLANALETFFLIFFLFANAFVTAVFMLLGHAKM